MLARVPPQALPWWLRALLHHAFGQLLSPQTHTVLGMEGADWAGAGAFPRSGTGRDISSGSVGM